MKQYLDMNHALGALAVAAVVAICTWVFTVHADVAVLKAQQNSHEKLEAHKNTRQDQIIKLRGRVDGHEGLPAHPEAQKTLIQIQREQAAHTAEIKNVQKSVDRIIQLLQDGPRPR